MLKSVIQLMLCTLVCADIRCINFYGIETPRMAPVCDWMHEPKWYLQQLKDGYGLNTVRLPYSREYAKGSNFKQMDLVIDACQTLGLNVILDYHRTYASHQGSIPTEGITLGEFLDTHIGLLQRYQDKIWGVSVFNEIQVNNSRYTNHINHLVVNAIESQFPGKYFYFMGCPTWGHNCSGITIPEGFENRSYIDIHQYAFTDNQTTRAISFPDTIPADRYFIGEIGAKPEEIPWLQEYLRYLLQRNISNLCFWTIAHSSDTGGLWKDDCSTIEQQKIDLLADFFNHTSKTQPPPCRVRYSLRREL